MRNLIINERNNIAHQRMPPMGQREFSQRDTQTLCALDNRRSNSQNRRMTDMTQPSSQSPAPASSLAGRKGWIITDGKAGMVVQAKGVADALGLDYVMKDVDPSGIWRILAPWGPVDPAAKLGQPGSVFAPPWPAVAIATGRASIPYIRAIKKLAGPQTYTVVLQDPKSGPGTADLIWVPQHDKRRGPNVLATLTSPHSFTPARLKQLADELPDEIKVLPSPRVAVVLGGKNGVYKFTEDDDARFAASLRSLSALRASFLITPSRRTHQRLIAAAEDATRDAPRILWTGEGANPYPHFLAAADILIVTADSVNMCGEACATGKPVYIFTPSGGSAKFARFHQGLAEHGATRPLPKAFENLENWTYEPLDSAARIAGEINRRYAKRKQMLSGIMS